jgi:uncharacterized protein YbaP (TraB family)
MSATLPPSFPRVLALAAALLATACGERAVEQATAQAGPPLLWSAEHPDGARAWLFGTIHVSDPRVTRLAAPVEAALEEADALWTELDVTPTVTARLVQAGSMPAGTTLTGILPQETADALRAEVAAHGGDLALFDRLRPWLAEVQLGMLDAREYMRAGAPALDLLLRQRATATGMRLGEIETVEEQLDAVAHGTEEQQIARLHRTLEDLAVARAEGRSPFRELFEAYVAGDTDALWALAEEQLDPPVPSVLEWWDAVYLQRNHRMVERLARETLADEDGVPFFAFGALHFLGPQGVVELLRAQGWTVTRVDG